MDSPNKARLRVAAVIGFTAIAGLVSGTTAGAVASSGGAVVEGAGAHPTIVVPADAWQSKCSFFVAKAADAAAVQKAAELKAEKVAAAKAKAEKVKAEKAERLAAAKAKAEAHKAVNDPLHKKGHHHGWRHGTGAAQDPRTGCDGHDRDHSGNSDG